jgi:hypothetical protein
MKTVIVLTALLFSAMLSTQWQVGQRSPAPTSAPCVAPASDHSYQAWSSSNTCTGGCSNGNAVTTLYDVAGAGAKNMNIWSGTGTYAASALNGYAAVKFNSTAYLSGSLFASTPTVGGFWAVLKDADTSVNQVLFGAGNSSDSSPAFLIQSTTPIIVIQKSGISDIADSTTAISTSSYVVVAGDYNNSTGDYHLYICSGGACTDAGHGTAATGKWTNSATQIIGYSHWAGYATMSFVESGIKNSVIDTTTLGHYAQCKYGL